MAFAGPNAEANQRINERTNLMKNHYGSLLALTCVSMLSCTSQSTRLTSLVSSRLLGPSPFAYVVNFVSNDVSGYTIDPDTGVLSPIAGPPVYARGPRSVAVDNGEFAYVANTASNLDSVSGYTIDRNTGALKDMAGLPVSVGDEPQSVAVAPSGEFAYVANGGGGVSGYTIDRTTGALKHMPASPFPAGDGPRSVAVDRSGKFAYVANFGRPSDKVPGNVSGYRIETTGALIPSAVSLRDLVRPPWRWPRAEVRLCGEFW